MTCDVFAPIGRLCDEESHASGVHHTGPAGLVLSDRPGDRIELTARLAHWDAEPGYPAEDEVVVDLGVELLELKTPSAVRGVSSQLSSFVNVLDQAADQLALLQARRLHQAVTDPSTELGKLLAEHDISVVIADGPNATLLDGPLLSQVTEDGPDALLLPPAAELPDVLAYVREVIPHRAAGLAPWRRARPENTAPLLPTTPTGNTLLEEELATYLGEHDLRLIRETDRDHIEIGRLGNDMCVIVPMDTTPEAVLDCARKHVANREPLVKHGLTWTYIDRCDGVQRVVSCPAFCRSDHSRDILSPTYAADIWHQDCGVGVAIRLSDNNDPPATWRVLEPQLAVIPDSCDTEGYQVPHVSVEFVEGVWSGPLGPDELADFIETLSGGLGKLRAMHKKLVTARRDWSITG
ncbi:DUF6907 domain-containing protein [Streptomyces sp. SAI-229]|uniref:DUF6907 domain-containing protein n=1 Tax=Streptomyces sp. SAI-229 TaxID=3377731 RepID=UPI003C7C882E